METTMTKIDDLVTVTVDRVFQLFLVDDERYELVDLVDEMTDDFSEGVRLRVPQTTNERTKLFLQQTIETFALGAVSMTMIALAGPSQGEVTLTTATRAQRASASLDRMEYRIALTQGDPREVASSFLWFLWSAFNKRLRDEHITNSVHFGHGAQS
jgi:hypothetical protein